MDSGKKNQLQKGIVAALLLVFAWTFSGALKSLWNQWAARPVAADLQTAPLPDAIKAHHQRYDAPEGREARPIQPAASETIAYTAATLRNPMVSLLPKPVEEPGAILVETAGSPPMETVRQPPAVVVQGVIWGSYRPQALIDGALYEVGDTIQNAQIVSIDRSGVTVSVHGATFALTPLIAGEAMAGK